MKSLNSNNPARHLQVHTPYSSPMIGALDSEQANEPKTLSVGILIREYRLRASFTAADLARLTEVSLETILNLEAGSLSMPLHDLYAICNVLNIPPSQIAAATHLVRSRN